MADVGDRSLSCLLEDIIDLSGGIILAELRETEVEELLRVLVGVKGHVAPRILVSSVVS